MREVNRRQRAVYVAGSKAKGWYEYAVQGTERSAEKIRLHYVDLIGRGPTREAAMQNAWAEATAWETARADQIIADNAL